MNPDRLNLSILRAGEVLSYLAGILCVAFFVTQLAQGEVQRRSGVADFELAIAPEDAGTPDTSLWAAQRIADYNASLADATPSPMGLLEVPSVGLKVPVYASDSALNMDRGAGIVDGMAYPHEFGNIGIAGHRDGYFRALKDVQVGDKLSLQTRGGPQHYTIDSRQIVNVDDLSLLQDTDTQTVTLITCYPFYFVGHAPQRFIVTASLDINDVNQQ